MREKYFKATNGLRLVVKDRKSAVIFEVDNNQTDSSYRFLFQFTPDVFKELLEYLGTVSNKSWTNITPKECNSLGTDYFEYYDRQMDNNGYLSISKNTLSIERPSLENNKLYQFNKAKMESFIYDFRKVVGS